MSYPVQRIGKVVDGGGRGSGDRGLRVRQPAEPGRAHRAAAGGVRRAAPGRSAAARRATPRAPEALVALVQSLTRDFGGKVGIAVKSLDDDWTVESNGDLKLPQQSVSKLWVAMTVLDARDAGKLSLDDPITVKKEDLTLFNQPIAALVKDEGYTTTVGELLQRAMTQSDNTANDRLLQYVGGPSVVRAFLAQEGDRRHPLRPRRARAAEPDRGARLEARIFEGPRVRNARARAFPPRPGWTRSNAISPIRPTAPRRARSRPRSPG